MTTTETFIPSKDASLESSISTLQGKLEAIGFHTVERSWLNEIENIWSVHISDAIARACSATAKGRLNWRLAPVHWASF